jgi:hypothetical protein
VLGRKLRQFTFWRAACLDFIKSPLAGYEGPVADLNTLLWAAECCRATYPHRPRVTRLRRTAAAWRFVFCSRGSMSRSGSPPPRSSLPASAGLSTLNYQPSTSSDLWREVTAFYAYLRDYNSRPIFGRAEGTENQPVQTPWYLFGVALALTNNPRLTLAQAWNSEVGQSTWYNAAFAEARGIKLNLLTPELEKEFREMGLTEADYL